MQTRNGLSLRKVGEFVDDRLAIVYSLCSEGTEWTPRTRDRILALIDEIRAGCEHVGTPLRRVVSSKLLTKEKLYPPQEGVDLAARISSAAHPDNCPCWTCTTGRTE